MFWIICVSFKQQNTSQFTQLASLILCVRMSERERNGERERAASMARFQQVCTYRYLNYNVRPAVCECRRHQIQTRREELPGQPNSEAVVWEGRLRMRLFRIPPGWGGLTGTRFPGLNDVPSLALNCTIVVHLNVCLQLFSAFRAE